VPGKIGLSTDLYWHRRRWELVKGSGFSLQVITLTIASQKGGVGKTTVSVNLAYALARRGWRVLLMDTDPQGSVGLSLSKKARKRAGFYDLVETGAAQSREFVLETRLPELKILTAGRDGKFFHLDVAAPPNWGQRFEEIIEGLGVDQFDVVIVDTAAGLMGCGVEILRRSDFVLVPQQAEPLGVRSISHILTAIAQMRRDGSNVQVAGVLMTMLQESESESSDVVRQLGELLPAGLLLPMCIPRDPVFLKASGAGVPVGLMCDRPPAAALAFDQLAVELEGRMKLEQEEVAHGFTRLMD